MPYLDEFVDTGEAAVTFKECHTKASKKRNADGHYRHDSDLLMVPP